MSNPNNTGEYDMEYPDIPLPKAQVHASHPYRNEDNHEKLLQHLRARLDRGKCTRDKMLPRYAHIDKKVAAWIRLSAEDQKRANKAENDGTPIMTDTVLPLEFVHLDDMMTYYAQTFAPSRGMFYHTGDTTDEEPAEALVMKMNNDALYAGYYKEILRGLFALLKYNIGGVHVAWSQDMGPSIDFSSDGTRTPTDVVRWAGNRVKSVDMYNFFYDTTVELPNLHREGEFAGVAEIRSHYWLQKRALSGQFQNCEKGLANKDRVTSGDGLYYRNPPNQSHLVASSDGRDQNNVNWVQILSDVDLTQVAGHEVITVYINLVPSMFGLLSPEELKGRRNQYELWRFTILDAEYIIQAERQNNVQQHLPYYFGVVNDDLMGNAQKSPAEFLEPLQNFASALLNIHIKASRAAIWGTTFYDPSMFDYKSVPDGEVAARVPMLATASGRDIRTGVYRENSNLESRQTMSDLESVMGLINQFYPTQALPSQIAGIDRAVTNQVEAVQNGVNRRQQKSARLIDETLMRPMRTEMYYNIIQYMDSLNELTDYFSGKDFKLDLTQLKDTNLPFIIGQGLKALDRAASEKLMQQLIFAIIQAPQLTQPRPDGQGIDLLKMIDYWTSMMDIDADFEQFQLKPTEEGQPNQDRANGTAAAAGGQSQAGIQPATDPQKLTAPIYS